ncbi:MAG: hypothetical protein OEV40_21800, partial [Acidimicrobiia bacterium]|nr:hypothetical protein [Acidimicrobiia bacterium]
SVVVALTSAAEGAAAEGAAAEGAAADLAGAAELLAAHADVPLTVVLGTDHIAGLQRDAVLAAEFRNALGTRPVVPITEPVLDPSSLAAVGQGGLYRSSVEEARSTVAALGLTLATDTVAVGEPQTTDGARLLTEWGTTTALHVPQLRTVGSRVTAGRLATDAGPLAVVAADATPAELGATGSVSATPADRAQRLLARLFVADGSRPIVVSERGSAADGFATLAMVLEAVGLAPVDVVPLADAAGASADLGVVAPATDAADDLSPVAGGVLEAQDLLATYDTFYVDGGRTPDAFRTDITALLATGEEIESRHRGITDLIATLQAELSVISLPQNQSVILAARSVSIPLTIENRSSGARQVVLEFRSDKIVVAEHGQLITIEPGTSSIDVQVEARSLGVSPLQVSVLSPDGRHTLSTTRFEVRSTAVPGLGLLISAIGLGLLALWWGLSIQRRRSAHPQRSALPPPDDQPPDDGPVDRDRALAGDSV